MAKNDRKEKKSEIDQFVETDACKELIKVFDGLFGRPRWWVSSKKTFASIKPLTKTHRARQIEDYLFMSEYRKPIARAIKQADRSKSPVAFKITKDSTYGIAIPLLRESKILGFFGLCAIKEKPNDSLIAIIASYMKLLAKELKKETELSRVYELVRPRAIALSTVHTIHRLISSTLDIKELFPRIARLTLQILKAERSSIFMIDKDGNKLVCVASVDYRKSKNIFILKKKASPSAKKVAQTGRCIYKKNMMCVPLVDEEICGVIVVRDKVGGNKFNIFDQEILTTLSEQAVIAIRNAQLYKEKEDLTTGTIKSLGYLLDAKFPRLYTHTSLFEDLMLELGKDMGLAKKMLKILHYSALLPDLGKLVMPVEILQKKKALSGKERKLIKTHTLRGIEVLKYLDVLKPVIPIILHHHEKYNGKGYPDKLKGEAIPLGARIMAVVDTFEAMVCHRPYRKPMPFRMAVSEIRRQSGKQFDPDVVRSLVHIAKDGRLEDLIREHSDDLRHVFHPALEKKR